MARTDIDKLIAKAVKDAEAAGRDLDAPTTVTIDGPADRVACWTTPAPPGSRARVIHHDARAGDVITVPTRTAIRLSVLGFIKEANDAVRRQQAAAAVPAGVDKAAFDAAVEAAVEARLAARAQADAEYAAANPPAAAEPAPDLSALTGASDVGGDEPPALRESGLADAELPTGAAELTAHLTQFPDDADRIRAIELAKAPKDRRATVLAAVGMTADEVAAAKAG